MGTGVIFLRERVGWEWPSAGMGGEGNETDGDGCKFCPCAALYFWVDSSTKYDSEHVQNSTAVKNSLKIRHIAPLSLQRLYCRLSWVGIRSGARRRPVVQYAYQLTSATSNSIIVTVDYRVGYTALCMSHASNCI